MDKNMINNGEQEAEGDKQEAPKEDTGGGNIAEMDKATQAANTLIKEMGEERARLDNSLAKAKLAGIAEAGKPIEEKKEETPKEYADRVMRNEV